MIPLPYITEWRNKAPWQDDFQVEQDLIIERALVEIFSDPFLKERMAFRGGTALHKLYLSPAARYSEDIDLVQTSAEPIKDTIKAFRVPIKSRQYQMKLYVQYTQDKAFSENKTGQNGNYSTLSCQVGKTRFELATPCTPYKCATGLRHFPNCLQNQYPANIFLFLVF